MKVKLKRKILFGIAEIVVFAIWYAVIHSKLLNEETDAAVLVAVLFSFILIPGALIIQIVDLVKEFKDKGEDIL